MNRAEKLKTLQGVLQGTSGLLQQLHRERRKASMPYLEAYGIIDAGQCPAELLNLVVMYGEIDEPPYHRKTFSEWLKHHQEVGKIKRYGPDTAMGFIDANDNQFDAVSLSFAKIRSRNFSYWYLPDCTVGDLRGYYNQSEASFSNSIIPLWFDTDMSPYERYVQRTKPV